MGEFPRRIDDIKLDMKLNTDQKQAIKLENYRNATLVFAILYILAKLKCQRLCTKRWKII